MSLGHLWIQYSPHAEIGNMVLAFYHLNTILNPVNYAIRLPEFRRTLIKGLSTKILLQDALHL